MMNQQKNEDYLSVEKIIQRIYETTNAEKLSKAELTEYSKEYGDRWRIPVTKILKAIEADEPFLSDNRDAKPRGEKTDIFYDYNSYEGYIKWILILMPYFRQNTIISKFIEARKLHDTPKKITKQLLELFKKEQGRDYHHDKLRGHLKENIISEKALDNYSLFEQMLAGDDAKLLESTLRSVSSGITLGDKHYLSNLAESEAKNLRNPLDYVHWLILKRMDYKAIKILTNIKQESERQSNATNSTINIISQRFYWLKAIAEYRIEEDKEFKQMRAKFTEK